MAPARSARPKTTSSWPSTSPSIPAGSRPPTSSTPSRAPRPSARPHPRAATRPLCGKATSWTSSRCADLLAQGEQHLDPAQADLGVDVDVAAQPGRAESRDTLDRAAARARARGRPARPAAPSRARSARRRFSGRCGIQPTPSSVLSRWMCPSTRPGSSKAPPSCSTAAALAPSVPAGASACDATALAEDVDVPAVGQLGVGEEQRAAHCDQSHPARGQHLVERGRRSSGPPRGPRR